MQNGHTHSHKRGSPGPPEEAVWSIDLYGTCTSVSPVAADLLGFNTWEIIGRDMHALVQHHYPDGREFPTSACPVLAVAHSHQPLVRQASVLFARDGKPFAVEISAEPISRGQEPVAEVVGALASFRPLSPPAQDVTPQEELRRAYQLAERRTAELDAVIESLPHGVFIVTQDGKIRSNQRARDMALDRVANRSSDPAGDALPEGAPEAAAEVFPAELSTLRRALDGESSEETVETNYGWIHSVAAPILLNGEILGGVAVNTDVTQSRLQEEALRRSEKLAAVGQLASAIAHEINNPLESITNLLYLIRQARTMNEVEEYARIAQSELSRVTEITVQTLRFHRQQSRPMDIDVAALTRSVIALYNGRLLVRSVAVTMEFMPAPVVCCLEGEIRQVFNNLIRNAADAMPHGGSLALRVHAQHSVDGRAGTRFTIADTGDGIALRIFDHLFEPFQTTKELTGTGLGLWVSKGIVDKHGGTLHARTARGKRHGTVFTVWLPVKSGELEAEMARHAVSAAQRPTPPSLED